MLNGVFCVILLALIAGENYALRTIRTENFTLRRGTVAVSDGLFQSLFQPKKTATASHILVKGPQAVATLTELKGKLEMSLNLEEQFAAAAAELSACPSGKKGGSLGKFKQGQMVPAFDKVVFEETIGTVHGPVKTPFGAHLILIHERSW